ncbi:MAG: hypothetical protein V7752_19390 [Halopseudomonas sp.]
MKLLNRSGLMLQPCQPYLDWINDLPTEVSELEQPLAPGALDGESRVYLIAEFEPDQSLGSLLSEQWQALFENELSAWDELGLHWPEAMSQELLQRWFEIKPLALAFDAETQPLMTATL